MAQPIGFTCATCGQSYPTDTREWLCTCGGLLDFNTWPDLDLLKVDPRQRGLWRYRAFLPLLPAWEDVTLGEGCTPLVRTDWEGRPVHLKLEYVTPTGSFKDRGASVLLTALRGLGIDRVVEDSSGNAGASIAAYAARAGIKCEICVPDTAAGPKVRQIAAYGAEIIEVKGRREYAALAAWAAAAHGAYYASHVYNPFFLAGIETLAFELWEQLDQDAVDAVLMPVGNGTLLLGMYHGFQRLCQAGAIRRLPRLFGVQAEACAPLVEAFRNCRSSPGPLQPSPTAASGIAISQPARGRGVLSAVRATNGRLISVCEQEISEAHALLASKGFHSEPTSAAAVAALRQVDGILTAMDTLVVILTGHGLKTDTSSGR